MAKFVQCTLAQDGSQVWVNSDHIYKMTINEQGTLLWMASGSLIYFVVSENPAEIALRCS